MTSELIWWITAVELPCFAGLFWLIWRIKTDNQSCNDYVLNLLETRSAEFKDLIGDHKLDVAKNYVTTHEVRQLEARLTSHLLRIEARLDVTVQKSLSHVLPG